RYLPSENSRSPSCSWISDACESGVTSARIAKDAAATMADAAATRKALCMTPPGTDFDRSRCGPSRNAPWRNRGWGDSRRFPGFREAKNVSVRVLLDTHAVVHVVD